MHNPMYAYSTYVHAALPSLLSHTYCLAGTLHLPLLRHNLAQIRAAPSPPVPDPHIPQILGRESQKWFLSFPLLSRTVHPNLVPAVLAWCSTAFHPPQCQEHLLSHIFIQLCFSPLPTRCCWVPIWSSTISSAACPGRGGARLTVGFMCWHSRK